MPSHQNLTLAPPAIVSKEGNFVLVGLHDTLACSISKGITSHWYAWHRNGEPQKTRPSAPRRLAVTRAVRQGDGTNVTQISENGSTR